MFHILIGSLAIIIGLWGIMRQWYMFIDILSVLIPLALIAFGIVALLAGIRNLKKS